MYRGRKVAKEHVVAQDLQDDKGLLVVLVLSVNQAWKETPDLLDQWGRVVREEEMAKLENQVNVEEMVESDHPDQEDPMDQEAQLE